MKINAAIARSENEKLSIEEVELRSPKPTEALVRIIATGICHTDAEAIKGKSVPLPTVLGHEGAGVIEEVGKEVVGIEPGDHVVLSYSYCGQCDECLRHHPYLCEQFGKLNFGGVSLEGGHPIHQNNQTLSTFFGQSSFASYSIVHQNNIVKVDKDVDLFLLGPLACGFQTGSGTVMNSLDINPEDTLTIFGAGAVGLSAVMAAKIIGVKTIIAVDIHDNRLEMAKELGATHIVHNDNTHHLAKKIKSITNGGVHYGFETTGISSVVEQAIGALKRGGQLEKVGTTQGKPLNITNDVLKEGKTVRSVIQGDSIPQEHIPKLIDYYKKGEFPIDKLIQFYNFEDINQAFADSASGKVIKPVVRIGEV